MAANCPNCRTSVPREANFCPRCGRCQALPGWEAPDAEEIELTELEERRRKAEAEVAAILARIKVQRAVERAKAESETQRRRAATRLTQRYSGGEISPRGLEGSAVTMALGIAVAFYLLILGLAMSSVGVVMVGVAVLLCVIAGGLGKETRGSDLLSKRRGDD